MGVGVGRGREGERSKMEGWEFDGSKREEQLEGHGGRRAGREWGSEWGSEETLRSRREREGAGRGRGVGRGITGVGRVTNRHRGVGGGRVGGTITTTGSMAF